MSVRIFVADAYGRTVAAHQLQKIFGPDVSIYCETNHVSDHVKSDYLIRVADAQVQEPFENKIDKSGFDLFFLSALLIREGGLVPRLLKADYGNAFSRTVAMSIEHEYLQEIKSKNSEFEVDFFHFKLDFGKMVSADAITSPERRLLRSYLTLTCEKQKNEIFYACESIRNSMHSQILNNTFDTSLKSGSFVSVEKNAGMHSVIRSLIHTHNWAALFADPIWLGLLKDASMLAVSGNYKDEDELMKNLMLLQKFFPEKTKEYIYYLT